MQKIVSIARGNSPLDLGPVRFPVLYADPPWQYEHPISDSRRIENQYPTMSLDEICALPVGDVATPTAVLFLWATNPMLMQAGRVLDAWGFTYRTNMVWVKDRFGMGRRVRQQHELLLIAVRGEFPTPRTADLPSSVMYAPRLGHSEKPHEFYGLIERMYPELPKLELFARGQRPGWHVWGNQSAVLEEVTA